LDVANQPSSVEQKAAKALVDSLRARGKWPAKPDLGVWYGAKGQKWLKDGQFQRCILLPNDPELFTRHEVLSCPPDVLVTNYSMLEYMLMRPLERPVFDRTREWLEQHPEETILLVVDEAHLYSGAQGTEVSLLLRRLRKRLGIPAERLQVICTSASFKDQNHAVAFGAQLTGKSTSDFAAPVAGQLALRAPAGKGSAADAQALADINVSGLYEAVEDRARLQHVDTFLKYRGVKQPWSLQKSLHEALERFPPMGLLVNLTMREAKPVEALSDDLFEGASPGVAEKAVTALVALGSLARRSSNEPGLLPCRVHSFYRGLAGLWACMDPLCTGLDEPLRNGPTGKLYGQPRDQCECGARVLELFTCRNCGSAYARAYTDDVIQPKFLWPEPGREFDTLSGRISQLQPLDLLLEQPTTDDVEPAEYDLVSGRLNPVQSAPRFRMVFLPKTRVLSAEEKQARIVHPGEFRPCGVCGSTASFGRTSVQDHQTKGDQPFQALIAKQIQVQPPSAVPATPFAPLRGRKVLIFSDSRQTAARLAPNLQSYSMQDVLRPLIVHGYSRLMQCTMLKPLLSLEDLYLAVLIAGKQLGVRLRPELAVTETFGAERKVAQAIDDGALAADASVYLSHASQLCLINHFTIADQVIKPDRQREEYGADRHAGGLGTTVGTVALPLLRNSL
jgi:Distinct helicase family with a unique C-terminal domain including a metal-binding cysteine cluster